MKIGIDARLINASGVGRYIKNLIENLERLDRFNEYYIFLLEGDCEKLQFKNNFKKILANFPWYTFEEQIKFPKLIKNTGLDLMHFPHFNVPIFYNDKFIVTIHDLVHQHFSQFSASTKKVGYFMKKLGYKKAFSHAIKNSEKIITVSNFTRKCLMDEWKIDSDKIILTYEGVDKNLVEISKKIKQDEIKEVLEKFDLHPPLIFYIGNAHPHKNLKLLIESFLILRKKFLSLKLVLSGPNHKFWDDLRSKYEVEKSVLFTGFLSDTELVAVFKSSLIFVIPSLEEGFGLPLLEAFEFGVPVASSSAGALKEIGGDSAIYFNPLDIDECVSKISQVLSDNALREKLIFSGKKRVLNFSWDILARKTLNLYNLVK